MITSWVKRKLGISVLEEENRRLINNISACENLVKSTLTDFHKCTTVDADVEFCGRSNTIILTGSYRNSPFVKFYDVGKGEFKELVEQLKAMSEYAKVRHVDCPPSAKHFLSY